MSRIYSIKDKGANLEFDRSYMHLSQPMCYMLYRTEWHVRGRGKQAAVLKTVGYHSSCLLKIPSNENFKTKYFQLSKENFKEKHVRLF